MLKIRFDGVLGMARQIEAERKRVGGPWLKEKESLPASAGVWPPLSLYLRYASCQNTNWTSE
jgi:hypothetical protein